MLVPGADKELMFIIADVDSICRSGIIAASTAPESQPQALVRFAGRKWL